jgi:hypothetical protein
LKCGLVASADKGQALVKTVMKYRVH